MKKKRIKGEKNKKERKFIGILSLRILRQKINNYDSWKCFFFIFEANYVYVVTFSIQKKSRKKIKMKKKTSKSIKRLSISLNFWYFCGTFKTQ